MQVHKCTCICVRVGGAVRTCRCGMVWYGMVRYGKLDSIKPNRLISVGKALRPRMPCLDNKKNMMDVHHEAGYRRCKTNSRYLRMSRQTSINSTLLSSATS